MPVALKCVFAWTSATYPRSCVFAYTAAGECSLSTHSSASEHHLERPNIVLSPNSDHVVFAQTSPRKKKSSCIGPERPPTSVLLETSFVFRVCFCTCFVFVRPVFVFVVVFVFLSARVSVLICVFVCVVRTLSPISLSICMFVRTASLYLFCTCVFLCTHVSAFFFLSECNFWWRSRPPCEPWRRHTDCSVQTCTQQQQAHLDRPKKDDHPEKNPRRLFFPFGCQTLHTFMFSMRYKTEFVVIPICTVRSTRGTCSSKAVQSQVIRVL